MVNLDELNYLAKRMDSFFGDEETQFFEAIKLEHFTDMKDLINLTFNLDKYTLIKDVSDINRSEKRLISVFLLTGRLVSFRKKVMTIKTPVSWMGNKTSILHILYALFPKSYTRYIEPFSCESIPLHERQTDGIYP